MSLAPYFYIAAALVGLGDTLYLSYFHLMGLIPSCALLSGCEQVLTSVYASPFGVPLAYLGLIYYMHALGIGILLAVDDESEGLKLGVLLYSGIGLLLSIGFELFQFFVIGALCLYCAISALAALALFCAALWHFYYSE